ncbi:unnamed protein product, partial [marine sediment metagenome]
MSGWWSISQSLSLPLSDSLGLPEVIIDNGDPDTSHTKSWEVSGGVDPYGADSLWSRDIGGTYTYQAPLTGSHQVSLRWTFYSSRCTNVRVGIYDGDSLLATVYVNQKENGSQWKVLGTYSFSGTAK